MKVLITWGSYYKSQTFIEFYWALHTAQGNRPLFLIKFFSMPSPKLSRDNQVLHKEVSFNIPNIFLDRKLRSTLWLICPTQKNVPLYNNIFAGKKFQFLNEILKKKTEAYRLSILLKKLKCKFKIIRTFVSSIAKGVFIFQQL